MYNLIAIIAQFADDTNLFLSFDPITLNGVINTLDIIEKNVGLKVNCDKTKLYRIGSMANLNATVYTIKQFTWTNEPVEILGILVGNDVEAITDINYQQVISKAEAVLQLWTHRGLTPMGKILVVNTLVASLFVYKLAVLPKIPKKYVDKFYDLVIIIYSTYIYMLKYKRKYICE